MSTVTRKPRNVKPVRPVPTPVVSMILTINGLPYAVERLDADPTIGIRKAYRLTKVIDTTVSYDVALTTQHGVECECPDFGYRRAGKDVQGCKHLIALRKYGMLPELPAAKPAVPDSIECSACVGDGGDPFQPDNRCLECGGIGIVPAPTPEEVQEMLANAPAGAPYTNTDIDAMAGGLIDIQPDPDDDLPF